MKTLGVKLTDVNAEAPKGEEGEDSGIVINPDVQVYTVGDRAPVAAINVDQRRSLSEVMADKHVDFNNRIQDKKTVCFDESLNQQFEVPAYSDLFIKLPR